MRLVVTVYLAAFAAMSVLHGPISDAVGRRPVMVVSLAVYVAASIACAFAPNLVLLLLGRAFQGLSAGGATIVSRTVIRDLFEGATAQRLMSRVAVIFGIAPAIGPIIGGLVLQTRGLAAHLRLPGRPGGGAGARRGAAPAGDASARASYRTAGGGGPRRSRRGRAPAGLPLAGVVDGADLRRAVPLHRRRRDLRRRRARPGRDSTSGRLFVPMIGCMMAGSWVCGRAAGRITARKADLDRLHDLLRRRCGRRPRRRLTPRRRPALGGGRAVPGRAGQRDHLPDDADCCSWTSSPSGWVRWCRCRPSLH
ncbi:multidrug effflux MFS transporter [Nocardioides sp. W3-2-3]|uniref:MFS transporter n=1 Tax=Nocardioides convexus TaxID=2712224 RepID=UPI0024182750|nr:MFS transporter [Nocardioides convexus]NHA01913.1 multidrug effflux MFS transporter [Nocardioides convexus]